MAIVSTGTPEGAGSTSLNDPRKAAIAGTLSDRKSRHLEICTDESAYVVESSDPAFASVRFLHRALPELDERKIDTSVDFLGSKVGLPFLISCMTGGSAEGGSVNQELAKAAQIAKIPVGMGSIRILFRDMSYFDQFHLKPIAPDVPVLANLSAVQLRDLEPRSVAEMLRRLEVEAFAVHLNAGQELFQPEGDRDFTGLFDAIRKFGDLSPVPLIVKETGFGMRPSEVVRLLDSGVRYVDIAGGGGTNWVRVESYRLERGSADAARDFDEWGIPTAILLAAIARSRPAAARRSASKRPAARGIIASGGVRSGLDAAKSLALGADLAGFALPFVRAVQSGGVDGVLELIARLEKSLRTAMTLTGCRTIEELKGAPLMTVRLDFSKAVDAILEADRPSGPAHRRVAP